LGRTVDAGRVWDIVATARYLRAKHGAKVPVQLIGNDGDGVLVACAILWESEIDAIVLNQPPESFMDPGAPQFLNVLRVCDVPELFGMLAPRRLQLRGCNKEFSDKVAAIYAAAGKPDQLVLQPKGSTER
jgi:hypothetical protein